MQVPDTETKMSAGSQNKIRCIHAEVQYFIISNISYTQLYL